MKQFSEDEIKIMHNFNEYYGLLKESGVTKGVTGIEDPTELMVINAGIATALTTIKGNEKEDYFA